MERFERSETIERLERFEQQTLETARVGVSEKYFLPRIAAAGHRIYRTGELQSKRARHDVPVFTRSNVLLQDLTLRPCST